MSELDSALTACAETVETYLDRLLPKSEMPEARVIDAMRYATLGGGKRIRPFLVVQSANLFNVSESRSCRAAAALEMVHCYSLVHDDLPAMDDDDMRRGRPTVHKEFDDATAILAGDALLTKSFEVLADPDTHENASVRANLCLELAKAAGEHGMVGGQMLDLVAEQSELDIPEITRLQRMKTGALISYSVEVGTILREVEDHIRRALEGFAHDLGLAYQITDDLLDATGDETETGKATGKDAGQGKATFVTILGVEGARDRSRHLAAQAKDHLEPFGARADVLREAVDFILDRRS